MKNFFQKFSTFSLFLFFFSAQSLYAQGAGNFAGVYKAVLKHEGSNFHQFAKITLRTVNLGGEMKVSGNVRVFFGEADSNEFLSYNYKEIPFNLVTRQISLTDEDNDVTFIGFLKEGKIEGEWYSSMAGRVGTFSAQKNEFPESGQGSILLPSLSGHYRGGLINTNPLSNLPERVSLSFVTTQVFSEGKPELKISGRARLYLGDFNTLEYTELELEDVQFNFYSRFLTARTKEYGLTFKGTMANDGNYDGVIYSDGFGVVGTFKLARFPK